MVQTTKELCVMDNHSSPVDSNPDFLLWSIDRNAAKKTILRDTIPAITRLKSSPKSGYNEQRDPTQDPCEHSKSYNLKSPDA